jgi:hypothetical protein
MEPAKAVINAEVLPIISHNCIGHWTLESACVWLQSKLIKNN